MPVDEESFNLITKSSKNIIEFVNGLKEDDKLISAVKSIPNMDSYLDGGEVAPILIAMSAQDIVSCLDALFGDVKLTTTGGIGLYTFFSQLNNNESSANSTSKCKITKCFCKSTPLVLRNSISFLVSH